MSESVTLKGIDDKISVHFDERSSYTTLREDLLRTLEKNKGFFSGSNTKVVISGRALSEAQRREIKRIFSMDYGMKKVYYEDEMKRLTQSSAVIEKPLRVKKQEAPLHEEVELVSKEYFDAQSIFIAHTVRSGQRIECEGDIVVLGDVNPGAEIIAGGSIAIFGTLRGLAHAGAKGREDVCVAAFKMRPKQLRLSGRVVLIEEQREDIIGEIAELKDDKVVIRPVSNR